MWFHCAIYKYRLKLYRGKNNPEHGAVVFSLWKRRLFCNLENKNFKFFLENPLDSKGEGTSRLLSVLRSKACMSDSTEVFWCLWYLQHADLERHHCRWIRCRFWSNICSHPVLFKDGLAYFRKRMLNHLLQLIQQPRLLSTNWKHRANIEHRGKKRQQNNW